MSSYSAQQSSISENNRSRILQYLYHNGISSRAQIAKAIELTPAAITKITAKLLFRDVIEETGDMEGDKNRRSIGLNLNCAKYHVVGVKFARSLVQIAVFDLKCNRISLTDLPTVDEEHIPETVEQIRATVRQLIADDSSIVAVGMAVPRSVSGGGRSHRARLIHAGLAAGQLHQGVQRSVQRTRIR